MKTNKLKENSDLGICIKNWSEILSKSKGSTPCPFQALSDLVVLVNDTDKERKRLIEANKKWFVSAVKCIYDDEYASNQAIVFRGPQGIGKTPFVNSYLPKEMREFIKTNPNLNSNCRDSRIALTSSLLIHFDGADDYFKDVHARNNYKTFMDQKIVRERGLYSKTDITRLRICSFLASCNESTFLDDLTDTKRWVVFNVAAFKNRVWLQEHGYCGQATEDFDINLCWAEAYQLVRLELLK